jgi:S1-C subfamily serine protease
MPIELRILSGSRGGYRQSFDKTVVTIGRHPSCDLCLDPTQDLDVSARHAQISVRGGRYFVRDSNSTNGTFLHGRRIEGEEELHDGDVIWLGAEGPRVEMTLPSERRDEPKEGIAATVLRSSKPRRSTGERVQVAVRQEMAGVRRLLGAVGLLVVAGIGAAYWFGHRESRTQVAELMRLLAESESTTVRLQTQLDRVGDTTFVNALRRQNAEIAERVRASGSDGGATGSQLDELREELLRRQVIQQGLVRMDLSRISEQNDSGVAFLVAELDGKPYGGTAFGVTPNGLLVTNKHNVVSPSGRQATRLGVKYANTGTLLHARVVKLSTDDDVDLALVQVEEPGTYPTVAAVTRSVNDVRVGSPVVSIGFPLSLDTPMDGRAVKTSLTAGTVSKIVPGLIQIDAYATHGSSGSPIFGPNGTVIGVIWGGPTGSQGRLTFAVSTDKLIPLLPPEAQGIVR